MISNSLFGTENDKRLILSFSIRKILRKFFRHFFYLSITIFLIFAPWEMLQTRMSSSNFPSGSHPTSPPYLAVPIHVLLLYIVPLSSHTVQLLQGVQDEFSLIKMHIFLIVARIELFHYLLASYSAFCIYLVLSLRQHIHWLLHYFHQVRSAYQHDVICTMLGFGMIGFGGFGLRFLQGGIGDSGFEVPFDSFIMLDGGLVSDLFSAGVEVMILAH